MRKLLAATPDEIFGIISPPPGSGGFTGSPGEGVARLITVSIRFLIIVAALFVLIYLLQGAFLWITSNGEDEKLQAARQQITHAILGFLMIFVAIAIFGIITGDILGIIKKGADGGWIFKIPTIGP